MAGQHVMPSDLGPDAVGRRQFERVRRGYDVDEVHRFLSDVAAEMRRLLDEIDRLKARPDSSVTVRHEPMDRKELTSRLGEEAARLLNTAQDAADEIRAKAEGNVSRLLREARDDAAKIRAQAEEERAGVLDTAEADAAGIREQAEQAVVQARRDAEQELERARAEGRAMLTEAKEVRDRLLADLNERRRAGRRHLEQLRAAGDSLREAYLELRHKLDEQIEALELAPDVARAAADRAAVAADRLPDTDPAAVDVGPPSGEAEAAPGSTAEDDVVVSMPSAEVPHIADARQRREARRTSGSAAAPTEAEPAATAPTEAEPAASAEATPAAPGAPAATTSADPLDDVAETDDEAGDAVDRLFAKLRSERVAAMPPAASDEVPAPAEPAPSGSVRRRAAPAGRPVADEIAARLLARRAETVERTSPTVARALKRAANDWLNQLLDGLRGSPGQLDPATVVGGEPPRAMVEALGATLAPAAESGAGDAEVDTAAVVADVVAAIGADIARSLRSRVGDEPADGDAMADRLRAVVREWRQSRAEPVAVDAVRLAFGHGVLAANAKAGTKVRWVCLNTSHSPDCEHNSHADPVPAGTPFPTGALVAPACAGCDCLVAPVAS
jgi:DivIVA domain-containing protein